MPEVIPQVLDQLAVDELRPVSDSLAPGEIVVISAGALQGALGTVIRKAGSGLMLVGLVDGKVAVRIPASLLSRDGAGS
jgi:hypothetical protein